MHHGLAMQPSAALWLKCGLVFDSLRVAAILSAEQAGCGCVHPATLVVGSRTGSKRDPGTARVSARCRRNVDGAD